MAIIRDPKKGCTCDTQISEDRGQTKFKTRDATLASFLYCRRFEFLGIASAGEGDGIFVFADSEELRLALVDYVNDGVVPVRTFITTWKDLRSLTG